MRDFEASTTK